MCKACTSGGRLESTAELSMKNQIRPQTQQLCPKSMPRSTARIHRSHPQYHRGLALEFSSSRRPAAPGQVQVPPLVLPLQQLGILDLASHLLSCSFGAVFQMNCFLLGSMAPFLVSCCFGRPGLLRSSHGSSTTTRSKRGKMSITAMAVRRL